MKPSNSKFLVACCSQCDSRLECLVLGPCALIKGGFKSHFQDGCYNCTNVTCSLKKRGVSLEELTLRLCPPFPGKTFKDKKVHFQACLSTYGLGISGWKFNVRQRRFFYKEVKT